jgi:hypothetical protein
MTVYHRVVQTLAFNVRVSSEEEVAVKNPHFLCAPTIKTRGCTTDQ